MSRDQFGEFVSGYRGVKGKNHRAEVVYLIYHKDRNNRNVTVESQVFPGG